jgi:hypothetical protein
MNGIAIRTSYECLDIDSALIDRQLAKLAAPEQDRKGLHPAARDLSRILSSRPRFDAHPAGRQLGGEQTPSKSGDIGQYITALSLPVFGSE